MLSKRVSRVVVRDFPHSIFSESIRTLRTNLQFARFDGEFRSLLITSVGPTEGKSMVAVNLAAAYALSGVKTVVIGADLRKPTLHSYFGLTNTEGLTTVLVGQKSVEDVLLPSDIPNLHALPSGPVPPSPAELLGSSTMRRTMDFLHSQFELVIVDAPPVLAVADASIMAPLVSGVLLLVNMAKTDRRMAQRARMQLEQVRARVVGVVANQVDAKERASDYYGYYEYGGDLPDAADMTAMSAAADTDRLRKVEPVASDMGEKVADGVEASRSQSRTGTSEADAAVTNGRPTEDLPKRSNVSPLKGMKKQS